MPPVENVADLNRRYGIRGIAEVTEGPGYLPRVAITAPEAAGEMYLLGGQVTSWRPADQTEVLYLSTASRWEEGRAIRGGIPVCFPWFGNKSDNSKAPAHGMVRAASWRLESIQQTRGAVVVSMFTESDGGTKQWWPADFRLTLRVTFGRELTLDLEMVNAGPAPIQFEEALHTYLRIGDIERVRIRGLDTVHYLDKTDAFREKTQLGELIIEKETDSVFLNTRHEVEIEDSVLRRRIHVAKENSLSTVAWNPWAEKAKGMSDIGDGEWKQMVCIETANVGQFAVTLAPGAKHTMKALIKAAQI